MSYTLKGFLLISLLLLSVLNLLAQQNCIFREGETVEISIGSTEAEVVNTALSMFRSDYRKVFSAETNISADGKIVIATLNANSEFFKLLSATELERLKMHEEAFLLKVIGSKLYVFGSDKRGTAYGILEISRMMGVSPWEWWADSHIETKKTFSLKNGFTSFQHPSVRRRGIFINDEDWGLTPWSYKNYEPSDVKGQIGPQTHARIFELLLRLRANTFWPAMHECSVAFYLTPGNKEMADKYGIYVGTSHCEPMVCNTNAEWKVRGNGSYNYLTNSRNILQFWEKRTMQLASSDNIYTLGIRGVHDGKMEGAKTVQEQKEAIQQIITDQREMIQRIVNPDPEKVSQVFIPYKEVLDVYNAGLKVPDDVTLMWCDDNYGYINHFPTVAERARKGGNGIYYHLSYWGRPHDYLWLSTTHPAQIYYQLTQAYNKGAREMWVINVGDIKPAEYNLEFIMDLAWNIATIENNVEGLNKHMKNWLIREFGNTYSSEILSIMNEYYRLAYIRKPEFMGNTRTEERDPAYKLVKDLPWSESQIRNRLAAYEKIEKEVTVTGAKIPSEARNSWFQLVEYPVKASAAMNRKMLYGQLARHSKASYDLSNKAYDDIQHLTAQYNTINNSKWRYIMDAAPRELAVFKKLSPDTALFPLKADVLPIVLLNGADYKSFTGSKPIVTGLGYERKAAVMAKNSSLQFNFRSKKVTKIRVEVAMVPTHPIENETLRFMLSLDNGAEQIVDIKTVGRSEEWKENVLTNQSIRKFELKLPRKTTHTLTIKALDEGIVLDQIQIFRVAD